MSYLCRAEVHFKCRQSVGKTIKRLLDMNSKPFEVGKRYVNRLRRGWVITGEYHELVEATEPVGIKTVEGTGGVTATNSRFAKREAREGTNP